MKKQTNVFRKEGKLMFSCNDCGEIQKAEDKTECTNCGAWYEMDFVQTTEGVDPFVP